ncbi:hypothetical protein BOX15_Mlig021075g1 [Macrostomum lignano]|uniref:Uncharacterized protein n=1 Tax=Macrostomum lignano TaxID=282301 RepID=A0A267H6E3_9PLAT|nr:hypothetical protein BOX15_Mlig021075g1 [Macrostomum lignano]
MHPHPTVRFAEPLELQRPHQPASPSVTFRLPSIGSGQQQPPPHLAGSPDLAAAASAIYDRHGYSPPRSPRDAASQWKYPLPSKSLRLYVGPPLRPAEQPAGAAASLPASRGGSDIPSPGLQLQRSRTEPAMAAGAQRQLAAPYVQSRAEIFLRRGLPPTALSTSVHQQPRLRREATLVSRGDEAERLRWTMSTQRHWQVDRKGQQRNQGPFSREFTVHVTAPSNWLRMKWGPKQLRQDLQAGDQRPSYLYTKQAFGQQNGY